METTNKILDVIGNTPLLNLSGLLKRDDVRLYAKAEYLNPSGSVKDRAAKAMILDGIITGKLTRDKAILDATSGNTGIAYAMIGAALRYKVILCLPKNTSEVRKTVLQAYGAQIIETDPLQSSDGAQIAADRIAKFNPERYFYSDQYNNEQNWKAHYNSTSLEIWEQSRHKVTHFIAGMGTSGTFMGTSKRLKELNPQIRTITVQPDSPFHGLEGMKHMASTILPGIYDKAVPDGQIDISTEEAEDMVLRLARHEGIFVGISSGANVTAAVRLAKEAPPGSFIVTVLCDSGFRYIHEKLWIRESDND